MKFPVVIIAVLLLPAIVSGNDSTFTAGQLPGIDYNTNIGGTLLKLALSLVLVVGLIYGSVFLMKKFNNKSMPGTDQFIKILGKSYLAPKQSLYVVKLGLSYAVLGVTESSVNMVKELNAEEVESLQADQSKKPATFQGVLKSVLRK